MIERETAEAALRVIETAASNLALGSYIIIHHDLEKNELLSDWIMCFDENGGPQQVLEKMIEFIEKIYPKEVKVRRIENENLCN